MEAFLIDNYRLLTHTVEILAAVTGIFCYKKYRLTAAKYFIYFLVYLTICDFLNYYTVYVRPNKFLNALIGTKFEKNYWWSTLFWNIGAIMFFSLYYNKILKIAVHKTIVKYAGYAFLLFAIIYIALHFDAYFYKFFPIISILGAIVILLCAILYFIEILNTDKILTFYRSLNFYISFAIFIWWLIITPIVFYDIYFVYEIGKSYIDSSFAFLRRFIYLFLNIFMYSTFTFALIWCKPEND
ncbi:hypothetical protein [uncultured Algibacter sp.]|uniref:hypothetical protein n=1 Tax=uncultured Algibacter sp. TaxID=298659 RepID=UPI0032173EFC